MISSEEVSITGAISHERGARRKKLPDAFSQKEDSFAAALQMAEVDRRHLVSLVIWIRVENWGR